MNPPFLIISDGEMYTRIFFIIQIDLQNALQNMLRGAFKSGNVIAFLYHNLYLFPIKFSNVLLSIMFTMNFIARL